VRIGKPKPETFTSLGAIPAEEVAEISGGLLEEEVEVRLNRTVVEHDVVIVCGPVFPHEVVGFSGGNKYFFPGVSGPEVIDLFYWLGALITNREIIRRRGTTPVRRLTPISARSLAAVSVEPAPRKSERKTARSANRSCRRRARRPARRRGARRGGGWPAQRAS
jgi:nickel-dependent lactate racemase